jgi:hypothetical protein
VTCSTGMSIESSKWNCYPKCRLVFTDECISEKFINNNNFVALVSDRTIPPSDSHLSEKLVPTFVSRIMFETNTAIERYSHVSIENWRCILRVITGTRFGKPIISHVHADLSDGYWLWVGSLQLRQRWLLTRLLCNVFVLFIVSIRTKYVTKHTLKMCVAEIH